MKLSRHLLYTLAAILVAALLASQFVMWWLSQRAAEEELLMTAERIRSVLMSMRRVYQHAFLDAELDLNEKTLPLLPAFALTKIADELKNFDNTGFSFNNVSDRARNHHNQADAEEMKAIAYFRENPKAERYTATIRDQDGQEKLLYARPIWVEEYCLKCHGKPEDAPPSIRERYQNAYGYQVGDLRGVLSIKVPRTSVDALAWQNFRWLAFTGLALFLFAGAWLVWALRREVIRPLSEVARATRRLARGETGAQVAIDSVIDEVQALAEDFNEMSARLAAAQHELSESEARYRLVAENSTDCITWEEPDGRFSYVSPASLRVCGLPPQTLLDDPEALLSRIEPEDRPLWRRHQERHAEAAQGLIFRLRRPDGESVWIEHECAPVSDERGRFLGRRGSFRDITARRRAEAEAERLAYHDALTGLPNRRQLVERLALVLASAQRHEEQAALALINLSGFKRLNEARGEAFGNRTLLAVAERLARHLREGDLVARTYGDEFALLLVGLERGEAATGQILAILRKLQEILAQPLSIDGEELTLSACIGITRLPAGSDDDAEAVLRRADTALARAKKKGAGEYAFFEEAMGEAVRQRFEIEKALRQALARNELRLFLQSQVDAAGCIVGAEALVRWQHPERGLVPPAQFIPIAEESKLIEDIGAWVLTEACRLIRRLLDAGRPLRLSVNLSARQFRQPGFERWLSELIQTQGADPALLTLEVTESLAIEDFAETVGRMHALRSQGIHFSLDDFGTGYSSLAYLKRLPISELKIDKSFILDAPQDADDAALIDTILAVASQLKLRVVAEGVETAVHAAFLDGKGEILRQGYFYGRPLPAEEWLAHWLNR